MNQTPAPSRRFLPPSSVPSTQKSLKASSTRRQGTSSSQLHPPSSLASPVSRAARFQTPAKAPKDEISTNLEDIGSSPVQSFGGIPLRGGVVDDDLESSGDVDDVMAMYEDSETGPPGAIIHESPDKNDPQIHNERAMSRQAFIDATNDAETLGNRASSRTNAEAEPDTPAPKRRKLSKHRDTANEPILLSSSTPERQSADCSSDQGQQDGGKVRTLDIDRVEQETPMPDITTPQTTSRFKSVAPSAVRDEPSAGKHIFRPMSRDSHIAAEMTTILPEAFSPSRRKGKADYVREGLADSVRKWVLQTATQESQTSSRAEITVPIERLQRDRTGKAILVASEGGDRWLLAGQPPKTGVKIHEAMSADFGSKREVVIKGKSTHWILPILGAAGGQELLRVAAHWELPP